ncbi:MAG: DHHA1 domain-containing protein [bacterium]|nr:DHHA1 domain-containing protein [bacterium]
MRHLCEAGHFAEPVARVLVNRGFFDLDAVERHCTGALKSLYDPLSLGGVGSASARILEAIERQEHIVVHGDYDVDGITGTALLVRVLRELGAHVSYFVPQRAAHGYGLRADTVKAMACDGAKVIITVDCGINAIEPARVAQKYGVDLIITDHHEPQIGEEVDEYELAVQASLFDYAVEFGGAEEHLGRFNVVLPPACAVINPKLGRYPFSELAGVGVAFKLAHGVVKYARERGLTRAHDLSLKEHLDLVALGTIADAVPLRDENHILAKHGLSELAQSRKAGIRALIASAKLRTIDVESVVFGLAPRLNAAGRMTDARVAVELLLTNNSAEAELMARELEDLNRERQRIERETFLSACAMFERELGVELPDVPKLPGGLVRYVPEGPRVIVLASDEWNPGVAGIVASRMVERYYLPAVIIAFQNDTGRGSCRSIRDFHIFDALRQCSHLLEAYGGHMVAAGLTIARDKVEELRRELERIARETVAEDEFTPVLQVDAPLKLGECTLDLCVQLERCAPFGQGNPRPLFLLEGVKLVEDPVILKDKHVRLSVMQDGAFGQIIAFNWAPRLQEVLLWQQMDMVVYPHLGYYRGEGRVEVELVDARERI